VPDEKKKSKARPNKKIGRVQRKEEGKEKAAKEVFFFWRQEIACTGQLENRFVDLPRCS
jgi:hypothetical protein